MVQKQLCDFFFFFLKKMQMQTILIMESQILVGGEVDRNHYGGKFSKISKEIEFFFNLCFHVKPYTVRLVVLPSLLFLQIAFVT